MKQLTFDFGYEEQAISSIQQVQSASSEICSEKKSYEKGESDESQRQLELDFDSLL